MMKVIAVLLVVVMITYHCNYAVLVHSFSLTPTSASTSRRFAVGRNDGFRTKQQQHYHQDYYYYSSIDVVLKYRPLSEQEDPDNHKNDAAFLQIQARTPPAVVPVAGGGFHNVRNTVMEGQPHPQAKDGLNRSLIKSLLLNQQLILLLGTIITASTLFFTQGGIDALFNIDSFNWVGDGSSSFILGFLSTSLIIQRIIWGIGCATPLLILSNRIEQSDQRIFSNINFATIMMVMTLFGRRKSPPPEFMPRAFSHENQQQQSSSYPTTKTVTVLYQSLILSLMTGICEEIVFRRELPTALAASLGYDKVILIYFLQALLFGLGHIQPGNTSRTENAVVVTTQIINGLGFGFLYVVTGGDIISCIIAHTIYDFIIFFKTWIEANEQLEYAESMYSKPLSNDMEKELLQVVAGTKIDQRYINKIKKLFYTFDFDKNQSLSLSEIRKGLSYMAIEKAMIPPSQTEIDELFINTIMLRNKKKDNKNIVVGVSKGGDDNNNNNDRLNIVDFFRIIVQLATTPFVSDQQTTAAAAAAG